MYPRQEYQVFSNQYPTNGYFHSCENGLQYTQDTVPAPWSTQSQPLQHKLVYPAENYTQTTTNSRLDPTLAYPVAIRPSVFEHSRFIDKMQPVHTRIKKEKYIDSSYHEGLFPVDPRLWTREDVARWLRWTSEAYNLENVKPDRFEMNGKGLCLMTMDMFVYRVPEGGKILYIDFQERLRRAVGSTS